VKIYIAGPWARREEVKAAAEQLKTAGHEITSRWLYAHAGPPNDPAGLSHSDAHIRNEALDDVADVLSADAFIILNLEKSEGKAFEMGVAYMASKPIICVGQRFNIFCTFGRTVDTIEDAINLLTPEAFPA
jgi:nucleoside 2-deoxyribosyltransferase